MDAAAALKMPADRQLLALAAALRNFDIFESLKLNAKIDSELEMGLAAFASTKPTNRWSRARLDGLGQLGRKPRFATSHEGARSMSREFSLKATLLALLSLPISNAAIAGVAENMGGVPDMLKRTAPVTKAQYDSSDDGDLCWYDQGWRGPGWYLCSDEWDYGVGWFGLHRNRHRHLHGIAIAHPVRESHHGVRVAGRPGVRIGGVHSIHHPRAGFAGDGGPPRRVRSASLEQGAGAVYRSIWHAPARSQLRWRRPSLARRRKRGRSQLWRRPRRPQLCGSGRGLCQFRRWGLAWLRRR